MKNNKELCECGKMAVWVNMPGFSSGDSPYFCDDCVPRGCDCNYYDISEELPQGIENVDWKYHSKEKQLFTYLDDQGREEPCCEYWYDEDGFDIE